LSDLSVVLIGVMITIMVLIPITIVVVEKLMVLSEIEVIEDLIDLAIEGIILELDRESLGTGELATVRRNCEKRVQQYLEEHMVSYYNLRIDLYKQESKMMITADVEARLLPHIFRQFLPKEVSYEIIRKYQLLLDR
jgi:hypothetical protein